MHTLQRLSISRNEILFNVSGVTFAQVAQIMLCLSRRVSLGKDRTFGNNEKVVKLSTGCVCSLVFDSRALLQIYSSQPQGVPAPAPPPTPHPSLSVYTEQNHLHKVLKANNVGGSNLYLIEN